MYIYYFIILTSLESYSGKKKFQSLRILGPLDGSMVFSTGPRVEFNYHLFTLVRGKGILLDERSVVSVVS